jgi:hypothetical protein
VGLLFQDDRSKFGYARWHGAKLNVGQTRPTRLSSLRVPLSFFFLPSAGPSAAPCGFVVIGRRRPAVTALFALRCRGGRVGGGHASTAEQAEAKLNAPEEVPCAARTTIMRIRESLRARVDDVRCQGRLVWKGHQGLRVLPAVGGPATVPSSPGLAPARRQPRFWWPVPSRCYE